MGEKIFKVKNMTKKFTKSRNWHTL